MSLDTRASTSAPAAMAKASTTGYRQEMVTPHARQRPPSARLGPNEMLSTSRIQDEASAGGSPAAARERRP